jgi:branched-chain amino acid transport system substrate-binding protein
VNRSTIATRRFKRLTATAALGVSLGLSLVACGDDGDSGATDKTSDSASTSESATTEQSPSESTAAMTDDKCAAGATSADSFKAGGILPETGNLAFLGPPEISGVGLAVSDINAAGGVNGVKACYDVQDSGDSTDLSISTASAGNLVAGKPSVVIGAASSSVSLNVVDTFADNKITEVSPANTAVDLSGYSPFYFRTAPPDGVQGNALGTLISQDGYTNIGFLVFNDTYGTGLRNAVQATIESAGGKCVYGCKGDGDEFPAGQTTFSAEVQAVTAAKPDAIVILAFDETKSIVPELAASGFDMSKTYYSDGNTADYSADFEPGTLEGAQGTIPGADPDQGFKDSLVAFYKQSSGDDLKDFAYGAESYDATILAALAAAKGGANDSQTVQKNFAAVSGATQGTECTSYADCLALITDGQEVRYKGPSGIGPIDDENDPSSAFVGIYQFDGNNKNILSGTVEGSKQ